MRATKALGAKHPTIFKYRNRLISRLYRRRYYAEAEAIYVETIILQTKVLRAGHLDTLKSRNSLVSALYELGKYA